jgi:hypothetical protein
VQYTRSGDQPVTNANSLQYHNLVLTGSGIKTAPAGSLIIKGNLSKSGTASFAHNNGTVLINGTTIQTYSSNLPVMEFYNITINNPIGFSTASDMIIEAELGFGNNAKLDLQSGFITLKSTTTNTANIGKIPATASISYQTNTGFIVERYIATGIAGSQHTKSWQLLAVPVNNSQTVKAAWQEGAASPNENPKPGYGTQITSNLSGATGLGFDVYSPGGASMKTFNPSGAGSWDGIPNTSSYPVYNNKGYMVFIRGDRSVINFSGPNSSPLPTTLRAAGKIFFPGSNPPPSVTVLPGKYESVGNPYASSIDLVSLFSLFTGDIQNVFYVWDPRLTTGPNSAYGLGGYRTLTFNGTNYDVTPPGGSYGSTAGSIQSGQAFLVKSLSSGGTVNFTENCKVQANSLVTRPSLTNMPKIITNLSVLSNNNFVLLDGVMNKFSGNYSNETDVHDALKITQGNESMSIETEGAVLSVNARKLPEHCDTIQLRLEQLKQRQYRFEFFAQHLSVDGFEAYLEDQFLHTLTEISLTDTTFIEFTTDYTTPGSLDASRFRIIFSKKLQSSPFAFMEIKGERMSNSNTLLQWQVTNEYEVEKYKIERSRDGALFYPIAITFKNHRLHSSYTYIDSLTPEETAYYRIQAIALNGRSTYSETFKINGSTVKPGIEIFPNPIADRTIRLHFTRPNKGSYHFKLVNSEGRTVFSGQQYILQDMVKTIYLPGISKGVYQLLISYLNGESIVKKVIVE